MRTDLLLFLLFACFFVSGCGSAHEPLSGKVTFEDGSPLPKGEVIFVTDSFQAVGTIQEDGTYTVGSLGMADGLPPGTYRVYISEAVEHLGGDIDAPTDDRPLVAAKYTAADTSGLTCEVPAEDNRFDITVTPPE